MAATESRNEAGSLSAATPPRLPGNRSRNHEDRVGRSSSLAIVGMDAFEVGEDNVSIEGVAVVVACVGHDGIGDRFFVVAFEVATASGTGLLIGHDGILSAECTSCRSAGA
jgi:hypothetical protein